MPPEPAPLPPSSILPGGCDPTSVQFDVQNVVPGTERIRDADHPGSSIQIGPADGDVTRGVDQRGPLLAETPHGLVRGPSFGNATQIQMHILVEADAMFPLVEEHGRQLWCGCVEVPAWFGDSGASQLFEVAIVPGFHESIEHGGREQSA